MPDVETPPSVDEPSARQHAITWRVALIGLVGALAAAIISAAAALGGVDITNRQATENDRNDFLRAQRQATWSKFIADQDVLEGDFISTAALVPTNAGQATAAVKARLAANMKDVTAAMSTLNRDFASVEIVSTLLMSGEINQSMRTEQQAWSALNYAVTQIEAGNLSEAKQARADVEGTISTAGGQRQSLIDDMRDALAS